MRHRLGQRSVRRLVREVFFTGEEPQKRAPLFGHVVAYRPSQHGVAGLERLEHRISRHRRRNLKLHLGSSVRERPQVWRNDHSYHASVCTSTESTAGRSRTMGVQLSPASAEQYTWPPVVPKYTPHLSSESTAMASRSTFT